MDRFFLRAVFVIFVFAGTIAAQTGSPADSSDVTPDTLAAMSDSLDAAADSLKKGGSDLSDTVFYESDLVDYDNDNRVLQLFGRAQVKYQNIILQADTIVYDVESNQFQARGRPQLIEGADTTVGDIMVYNIKTRRGRVNYSTVRFDDTYFTGENIVKSEENCLYIERGDYTTCENPNHPHYYFYSEQIKIVPDDMAVGKPVVLNVGDAPVAILPFFAMPLQRGRRSGWLMPSWGGSVSHGGYLENLGYYYAPNDYCDFTLSTKVQEFSSFVFNAGGQYALRYKLNGSVSARYALDSRFDDESRQWALDYKHNQNLAPDNRTTLYGSGSILSNRSFNQMYSDETSVLEQQQLDANMALSHKFQSINASANLVWRRNHNLTTDRILEDIPSFDFNLHNRAFFPYNSASGGDPSWYNNIYYSYNTKANMRRDAYGNDSLPGFTRPGMEHNVNLNSSQKLLKYFDVSPYFNMRGSMFLGAIDTLIKDTLYVHDTLVYKTRDPDRDTRAPDYTLVGEPIPEYFINEQGDYDTLYTVTKVSPMRRVFVRDTLDNEFNLVRSWNTGVNLSTRIYGLFPIGLFGVTAVRHTMTPTIGYAFVPQHEVSRMFYDVRINYDRPRPNASQLMNLSLSNSFQGKRVIIIEEPKKNMSPAADSTADSTAANAKQDARVSKKEEKFDILTVSLSTSHDFEADRRKWRDISLNASTSLNILRLSYTSNYWLYDMEDNEVFPIMRDYNIGLTAGSLGARGTFWDGDLLSIDTAAFADLRNPRGSGGSQNWDMSVSPGFNYRASRVNPKERFTPTKSFNLSAAAGLNLTRDLSVRWNGNYDFSSNEFSHNNYSFIYDLECWEMRFTWRPEKINPGFHFVVNVKKLPDFKWEQKESRSTSFSGGLY